MVDSKQNLVERLFLQHRDALQSFFSRRIRRRSDAADLVQEAYLRILRVKDADAINNPEGYLYTVASNLVREHAVLNARHAAPASLIEDPAQDGRSPGIEELFDTDTQAQRLRQVLAQLPPKCRAVVYLKYQHGLSYREMAHHIGVSEHMVQKYLGSALAHCRRRMTRLR